MIRAAALPLLLATLLLAVLPDEAQDEKRRKRKRKAAAAAAGEPIDRIAPLASFGGAGIQADFPATCLSADGTPVLAWLEWDRKVDVVRLGKLIGEKIVPGAALSEKGDAWQPGLARAGDGAIWCVWSQMQDGRWNLLGRRIVDGHPAGGIVTVAASPGNDVFPDVKADRQGRVWVAWQRFEGGLSDVFVAHCDSGKTDWSKPVRVTNHPAGDWEPRLAFGAGGETLVLFDSYRNSTFDVFLARIAADGKIKILPIATSKRYEARAEAATSPDGKTLWIAWEEGPERWGKDLGSEWRQTGGGLHYDRHLWLGRMDLETGKVERIGDVTNLTPQYLATLGTAGSPSICLPDVQVDGDGNPWVVYRLGKNYWQVAVTAYDAAKKSWAKPRMMEGSGHCLDRRPATVFDGKGGLFVAWPSDDRGGSNSGVSNVRIARVKTAERWAPLPSIEQKRRAPTPGPVNDTPERNRNDRHTWAPGDEKFTLTWGDLHRHSDFSNCRTSDDGSIVEHFRYGYEATGLDYLATTDHSDQGASGYSPYEWWQSQKLQDLFHTPGVFLTFYGYEREQKYPYGHRNVIYLKRGGPILYISRARHERSPWGKDLPLPPPDGARKGEMPPWQLWDLLRKTGRRVVTLEHTPAGGMGTDWSVYKQIDHDYETLVEIYQGSRNSYEGSGLPQPAVAARKGPMTFKGNAEKGTYQNALHHGHKLGVFASSDHRTTNISFGGLYVKKFDREGVFEAIDARRSIAATDKIFMEFSCNGRLLGSIFETKEKPTLKFAVHGTAPIKAVTLVRNETNYKVFTPGTKDFEATFTDENPVAGENRYYLRVEQTDGNMGWTSPVWVTITK